MELWNQSTPEETSEKPTERRADDAASGFIVGGHEARCSGETYTGNLNVTLVEINKFDHSQTFSLR